MRKLRRAEKAKRSGGSVMEMEMERRPGEEDSANYHLWPANDAAIVRRRRLSITPASVSRVRVTENIVDAAVATTSFPMLKAV